MTGPEKAPARRKGVGAAWTRGSTGLLFLALSLLLNRAADGAEEWGALQLHVIGTVSACTALIHFVQGIRGRKGEDA